MSEPVIYYNNVFSRAETLSGSESSSSNPVRRVGDGDRTLKYYLFSSPGTPTSGTVHATLATADAPTHFVQARATAVSGYTVKVFSSDVGGGNQAQHLETVLSGGDSSFSEALSGVTTARRCWWVEYSCTVSGLGACNLYELMLADAWTFPREGAVGVARSTVQNYQQLQVPGAASFKLRLGEDYKRVAYQLALVSGTEVTSGQTFLQTNDGGEPFWFADDLGSEYWAELANSSHDFDDQAGIYFITLGINEVPLEQ